MNYFIVSLRLISIAILRNKQVQFFQFFLPIFLLIIFSYIFYNPKFTYFSISTLLILSHSLYSIGLSFRIYEIREFDKVIKLLPANYKIFYIASFISRLLIALMSLSLISIVSYLMFLLLNEKFNIIYTFKVFICFILGSVIFGTISIVVFKNQNEINFLPINLIYYFLLFFGGIFLPVDILPDPLKYIALALPTSHMMLFMLSKNIHLIPLILWVIFVILIYYILNYKPKKKNY